MNQKWKVRLSALLAALQLVMVLPVQALAARENAFILVAESEGHLVIEPEYVSYQPDWDVRMALDASGHTFQGLESGQVYAINGKGGGTYTRSDQNGGHNLSTPAKDVTHYRFSEQKDSKPNAGLQKLMTAMADYNALEEADIRRAAEAEYQTAKLQFVGATSSNAEALANQLNKAMQDYRDHLNGIKYTITFSDGSAIYSGVSITARNEYGRVWEDEDGDGRLSLPKGTYDFCVEQSGLRVTGTVAVSGAQTITAKLPTANYLDLSSVRLSGSGGEDSTDETVVQFRNGEFGLGTWNGRSITVPVPDTFAGRVYINAMYTGLNAVPALTAIYTPAGSAQQREDAMVFGSLNVGTEAQVLSRGAKGNTVIYRVSNIQNGYTYSQDYTVTFVRTPSLQSLLVLNEKNVGQAPNVSFEPGIPEYSYKVLSDVTKVTVKAAGMYSDYQIRINGQDAGDGVSVDVDGNTDVTVTVTAGDYSQTYLLHILPGAGRKLTLTTEDADTTAIIVNSSGALIPAAREREYGGRNLYYFTLIPGEVYSCIATKDTYYHTSETITMENADVSMEVSVPTEDWLTELALGGAEEIANKGNIGLDSAFLPEDHSYHTVMEDTRSTAYLWVNGVSDADYTVFYNQLSSEQKKHGVQTTVNLKPGWDTGARLKSLLMQYNPYGNMATLQVSRTVNGVRQYQDYELNFDRKLTLQNLSAAYGNQEVSLIRTDTGTAGFSSIVKDYTVKVPLAADGLDLSLTSYTGNTCFGEDTSGYRVRVNDTDVTQTGQIRVGLNGTIETETIRILVTNEKTPTQQTEYTLQVLKSAPVNAVFTFAADDAVLNIHEKISQNRIWPDETGVYQLCEGFEYYFALTSVGYVGQDGTIRVARNDSNALMLYINDAAHPVDDNGSVFATWSMTQAVPNESLPELEEQWPDFRGNRENNAVTGAPIPNHAGDSTLYWAKKLGDGMDTGAVGNPIIVGGKLITYAGSTLYRVDPVSGDTLDSAPMAGTSSFAITPPAYYEGMIFVALADGKIQAFHAETLESLWVYTDPLGGQPNCPITFHNGKLYTGFWNQERSKANFVCVTVTDEDPAQTHERKVGSWYVTHKGGFYWAGACVRNGYVLVGTDDGDVDYTEQTSNLLLLDADTGRQADIWAGLDGDIRSTIMYDKSTDAYYFTSKGGTFYRVRVVNGSIADRRSLELTNGRGGVPMSTSTPVVYNGRAYIGVSGTGQFSQYGGHNITVIDLEKNEIAYQAPTCGYPQTSGLLTTAYEEETGFVYVYFFDNMTPGKLRVLRDSKGQTRADYLTREGDYTTAYTIFTPVSYQAEYAICSPIVDEYGTIYFKNDSGYLMAFGSSVKELKIDSQPDKREYTAGEQFDAAGMKITAVFENGKERDVTEYLRWSTEPLTEADALFTVTYPLVMYHNQENDGAMDAGVTTMTPRTQISLNVFALGDVNRDKKITAEDAERILQHEAQMDQSEVTSKAGDVTGDGIVDSNDAVLILQYAQGQLDSFPAAPSRVAPQVTDEEELTEEVVEEVLEQ